MKNHRYLMAWLLLAMSLLIPSGLFGQVVTSPGSSRPLSEQFRLMPVPASLTAAGKPGDMAIDADTNELYVYTGNGRAPHSWVVVSGSSEVIGIGDVLGLESALDAKENLSVTVNAQTDDYPLVLTDAGKLVTMDKATANTLTVPLNATVAFPVGTRIGVRQLGAGATSIAATGGVTITQRSGTLVIGTAGRYASLFKTATDAWELSIEPRDNLSATTNPTVNDDTADGYQVGSLWRNTSAGTAWQCFDNTATAAVWKEVGGASGSNYLLVTLFTGTGNVWTNMPASLQFINGSVGYRSAFKLDLDDFTQVRFRVSKGATAGATGSKLILRYHTSLSTSASDYSDIGTSEVSVAVDVGAGVLDTGWVNLAAGAIATNRFIVIVGSGGDGTIDPDYGTITAEFQ